MKKAKKVISTILTMVMVISVFTAFTMATSAKSKKAAGVTITIWHYLNDREALLQDFASKYEAKTGVKVDLQLYSGDQMKAKVQAAAQAKSLPDAWVFAGGKDDLLKYAAAGNVMNLTEGMKTWSSRFNKSILEQVTALASDTNTPDKKNVALGIYGVPLDVNNMQFLYNKDLFKKAGINAPPKTWNEFIADGKKLNAAKITPFATGIGSWVQYSLTEQYQYAYMGKARLIDSRNGKISYKSAGMTKVLNMIAEMRDNNMLAEGSATMDLPAAEQMFVNGQVAMIYDGSWAVGVFNSMNPAFKNYGVFFPPMDTRATYKVLIPGGIGAYLVVNKDTSHSKETIDFIKWLTDKEQQIVYANQSFNLPANKEAVDFNKLLPQTAEFANDMDKLQYAVPGYKVARASELYGKGIQSIVIKQKTPEQVVQEMDSAK
jgi:ABC-type glycerol-3-phosphate transport system substrate-binding protein